MLHSLLKKSLGLHGPRAMLVLLAWPCCVSWGRRAMLVLPASAVFPLLLLTVFYSIVPLAGCAAEWRRCTAVRSSSWVRLNQRRINAAGIGYKSRLWLCV